jgi:CRP/FNR family transcriptional regulator, cyclic AMP receptor protein
MPSNRRPEPSSSGWAELAGLERVEYPALMESSHSTLQLARSPLLTGLDPTQRAAFVALASFVQIDASDAILVREGEPAENFYVILTGEAEVLKREHGSDRLVSIAKLGPGDHFGETALFHAVKRTATVRALTPMTVAMIKTHEVRESPASHPWLPPFLLGLVRGGTSVIDRLTKQTADGLRAEAEGSTRLGTLNRVLIYVIASLSIYAVSLALAWQFGNAAAVEQVGNALYLVLGFTLLWLLHKSGSPAREFGLRFADNVPRELGESLLVICGAIGLLTGLEWLLITSVPGFQNVPLFAADTLFAFEIAVYYTLLIPLQELMVRGFLQGSLETVFADRRHRTGLAIVLSNAAFAAIHLHVSPYFGVLAPTMFVLGLPLGWLYARHRSLLGVALAHVIIALWALRVLNFPALWGALTNV